jgi:hypothetical protein
VSEPVAESGCLSKLLGSTFVNKVWHRWNQTDTTQPADRWENIIQNLSTWHSMRHTWRVVGCWTFYIASFIACLSTLILNFLGKVCLRTKYFKHFFRNSLQKHSQRSCQQQYRGIQLSVFICTINCRSISRGQFVNVTHWKKTSVNYEGNV